MGRDVKGLGRFNYHRTRAHILTGNAKLHGSTWLSCVHDSVTDCIATTRQQLIELAEPQV
jgi:hypothetical protein